MRHLVSAFAIVFLIAVCASIAPVAHGQENPPAVVYEGMMDGFFGDDDGYVAFDTYDLVFAPEGQVDAAVGLVNENGEVLAQFPFYPDYKLREGVFGRLQVVGPAGVQLTEPGLYTIVVVVGGVAVSRFPFLLKEAGDGSDPYDPQKTYTFDGYWRTLAHITTDTFDNEPIPVFSIWLGGPDMASPDTFQATFEAELYRDGELVAHAKKDTSGYSNGHFRRQEVQLYHPHDDKDAPNAIPLTMADMLVDGAYELKVTRSEDGAQLRDFTFTVADGEILPLPATKLGFEPAVDFIAPRVTRKGSTAYEFEEVVWIVGE